MKIYEIEVKFDENSGKIDVDFKGAKGKVCVKEIEDIFGGEDGVKITYKYKPEYYEEDSTHVISAKETHKETY